jgi:hypothetical protein
VTGVGGTGTHTLRLTAVGSLITLYVDGVSTASITDTSWASGQPGIEIMDLGSGVGSIDNFVAGTIVASDDFNRANGPVGSDWTVTPGGTLTVVSNTVQCNASSTDCFMTWVDPLDDDQWAEVDATYSTAISEVTVAVRQDGSGNGYAASWGTGSSGQYTIFNTNGWVGLANVSGVGITGTRRIRLEVVGTAIRMYVNGILVLSATDSTYSSGKPGISAWYDTTTPVIDNFTAGNMTPLVVYDNFNRANGAPGANWSSVSGGTPPTIISNQLVGAVSLSGGVRWAGTSVGNDCFVEANCTPGTGTGTISVQARADVTTDNEYAFTWGAGAGGEYILEKWVGGVVTNLGNTTGVGFTGTRRFRIEVEGTAIRGYVNGVLIHSATDSAVTSGLPCLYITSGAIANSIDNVVIGAL